MNLGFYGVFLIAGVLAVQFFLSTRQQSYSGFILPVAYVVFLTWLLITQRMESMLGYMLYLLLGLLFLLAEWKTGRKYVAEKSKTELDKIKAHDIH